MLRNNLSLSNPRRARAAPVRVQVDSGFGDVVTPAPEEITFPALLDFPAPHLRAYPIYTVVAAVERLLVRRDLLR